MKNFIRSTAFAILGWFAFVALTGFTNFTAPARHPSAILGSDSLPAGTGTFLINISAGTVPRPVGTIWQPIILNISNAVGAAGTLLATGTVYGGTILGSQTTLSRMTMYVSVASSNTAANTVLTASDGTNTCTFTFACNANAPDGTLTTGPVSINGVDGAGTGCTMAASAALTVSTTTQGCGTAATVKSIVIYGRPGST